MQRSNIHIREARSVLSTIDTDPISSGDPAFFPLASEDLDQLDKEVTKESNRFKNDWFAYNGGSTSADDNGYKKPLFFDIALNYVQLDMDSLQERAGKKPQHHHQPAILAPAPVRAASERQQHQQQQPIAAADKRPVARAKAEEIERAATPEPEAAAKSGLSSLLGGWWGRR